MGKAIWHMGVADLHSGSNFALIPPDRLATGTKRKHKDWTDAKWALWLKARKNASKFWEQFMALKRQLPKIDYCYILSDNIEGHQGKGGSAALVSADVAEQRDIAVEILNRLLDGAGNPKVYGCRGTPYHVTGTGGTESDDIIYDRLHNMQAYDDILFCETGGLIWRLQHFIARSGTPYGKQTPISKQLIQNMLSAAMGKEHDANVSLFGHVHYSCGAAFPSAGKYGFALPALKARGESYGRQFNDFYDVGLSVWKQECEGAPLQDYTKEFKIKVAYDKPTLWKG